MNKAPSLFTYFLLLQKEYLLNEFRFKVYPLQKDKNYFEKVLKGKKAKIIDIALRNHFSSIFNDIKIREKFYKEIFPEFGFPTFTYSKKDIESGLNKKDKKFYYKINVEYRFLNENGEELVGILKKISWRTKLAFLSSKGASFFIPINKISRIL